jgi:hypothetical protein
MSTFSVRISSRLKRALRKSARAAGNNTTISDVIRDAVTRYVSDGGSLEKSAATERARQYVMSASDVEELRELLRTEARMEVHKGLAKRVDEAVAKAISQVNPNANYNRQVLDYSPAPGGENKNSYPGGGKESGESFADSSPDKAENTWQGDTEDSDPSEVKNPVMNKVTLTALRQMGVKSAPSTGDKKLKKSTDVNPTQSFTVSSNEFVPEKSAGYKSSADYATGERLPAPFKVAGQLMETEYFNKRLTEEGGRTPQALDQLAKSIAAGSGMDGDEYTTTVAAMFGTLKKA